MTIVFDSNCGTAFFCGIPLSIPIDMSSEAGLIVACLMAIVACMRLESFIRKNALLLLEREIYLNELYLANIELKKELRRDNKSKENDMEAPLTTATMILKNVKTSGEVV